MLNINSSAIAWQNGDISQNDAPSPHKDLIADAYGKGCLVVYGKKVFYRRLILRTSLPQWLTPLLADIETAPEDENQASIPQEIRPQILTIHGFQPLLDQTLSNQSLALDCQIYAQVQNLMRGEISRLGKNRSKANLQRRYVQTLFKEGHIIIYRDFVYIPSQPTLSFQQIQDLYRQALYANQGAMGGNDSNYVWLLQTPPQGEASFIPLSVQPEIPPSGVHPLQAASPQQLPAAPAGAPPLILSSDPQLFPGISLFISSLLSNHRVVLYNSHLYWPQGLNLHPVFSQSVTQGYHHFLQHNVGIFNPFTVISITPTPNGIAWNLHQIPLQNLPSAMVSPLAQASFSGPFPVTPGPEQEQEQEQRAQEQEDQTEQESVPQNSASATGTGHDASQTMSQAQYFQAIESGEALTGSILVVHPSSPPPPPSQQASGVNNTQPQPTALVPFTNTRQNPPEHEESKGNTGKTTTFCTVNIHQQLSQQNFHQHIHLHSAADCGSGSPMGAVRAPHVFSEKKPEPPKDPEPPKKTSDRPSQPTVPKNGVSWYSLAVGGVVASLIPSGLWGLYHLLVSGAEQPLSTAPPLEPSPSAKTPVARTDNLIPSKPLEDEAYKVYTVPFDLEKADLTDFSEGFQGYYTKQLAYELMDQDLLILNAIFYQRQETLAKRYFQQRVASYSPSRFKDDRYKLNFFPAHSYTFFSKLSLTEKKQMINSSISWVSSIHEHTDMGLRESMQWLTLMCGRHTPEEESGELSCHSKAVTLLRNGWHKQPEVKPLLDSYLMQEFDHETPRWLLMVSWPVVQKNKLAKKPDIIPVFFDKGIVHKLYPENVRENTAMSVSLEQMGLDKDAELEYLNQAQQWQKVSAKDLSQHYWDHNGKRTVTKGIAYRTVAFRQRVSSGHFIYGVVVNNKLILPDATIAQMVVANPVSDTHTTAIETHHHEIAKGIDCFSLHKEAAKNLCLDSLEEYSTVALLHWLLTEYPDFSIPVYRLLVSDDEGYTLLSKEAQLNPIIADMRSGQRRQIAFSASRMRRFDSLEHDVATMLLKTYKTSIDRMGLSVYRDKVGVSTLQTCGYMPSIELLGNCHAHVLGMTPSLTESSLLIKASAFIQKGLPKAYPGLRGQYVRYLPMVIFSYKNALTSVSLTPLGQLVDNGKPSALLTADFSNPSPVYLDFDPNHVYRNLPDQYQVVGQEGVMKRLTMDQELLNYNGFLLFSNGYATGTFYSLMPMTKEEHHYNMRGRITSFYRESKLREIPQRQLLE